MQNGDRKKPEVLGDKPAPVLVGPPQILHRLTWVGTLASAVRDRTVIA